MRARAHRLLLMGKGNKGRMEIRGGWRGGWREGFTEG